MTSASRSSRVRFLRRWKISRVHNISGCGSGLDLVEEGRKEFTKTERKDVHVQQPDRDRSVGGDWGQRVWNPEANILAPELLIGVNRCVWPFQPVQYWGSESRTLCRLHGKMRTPKASTRYCEDFAEEFPNLFCRDVSMYAPVLVLSPTVKPRKKSYKNLLYMVTTVGNIDKSSMARVTFCPVPTAEQHCYILRIFDLRTRNTPAASAHGRASSPTARTHAHSF